MEFLTLSQLNRLVSENLRQAFPDTYWIMAETSDVRVNHSGGHCYLELIEKNGRTGNVVAKARAYIWKNTFQLLKPYFEQVAGREFVSGLKVLIKVGIDFHELYGYGLTVYDIDPTYTIGDIQRRKQEIIRQLEEDGVLEMNKELKLSPVPQRIAIITSPTAAGYEDFMNHLMDNKSGFVFYPKLFPTVMQGEQTEASVISALNKIFLYKDQFNVVVIIRGGGASSDLSAFDSYLLAANCAQFPLPVIIGIGHERDDTILDVVAYKRVKTPTAVADYLIERMQETSDLLTECCDSIVHYSQQMIDRVSENLHGISLRLSDKTVGLLGKQQTCMEIAQVRLKHAIQKMILQEQTRLTEYESFLRMSSPQYILSKGYSLVMKDGKTIQSVASLHRGDKLRIQFKDGEIGSIVE